MSWTSYSSDLLIYHIRKSYDFEVWNKISLKISNWNWGVHRNNFYIELTGNCDVLQKKRLHVRSMGDGNVQIGKTTKKGMDHWVLLEKKISKMKVAVEC